MHRVYGGHDEDQSAARTPGTNVDKGGPGCVSGPLFHSGGSACGRDFHRLDLLDGQVRERPDGEALVRVDAAVLGAPLVDEQWRRGKVERGQHEVERAPLAVGRVAVGTL